MTKILYILQIQSPLMISFPQKNQIIIIIIIITKLNVMDYIKLSTLLSAQILVAFKIIITLDYIEFHRKIN